MEENEITERVIAAAMRVHTALGPGLLESAYEECLSYELLQSGLNFKHQQPMPLVYREIKMELGYRLDLFVDNKVIVEIKAVEALNDVHMAQVLTYLKLSNSKVALLINFNVTRLKYGIKRVVNNY